VTRSDEAAVTKSGGKGLLSPRRGFRLEAVVFDFDGTLTEPGALDFAEIKRSLGLPSDQPILEAIADRAPGEQRDLHQALEKLELEAAVLSRPNRGAEPLLARIKQLGLRVGVVTRNGRASVVRALENFESVMAEDFEVLVTRDVSVPPKPAPDPALYAVRKLGVPADRALFVGDHWLDVEAGMAAGAVTVLVENTWASVKRRGGGTPGWEGRPEPHFRIPDLGGLEQVLRLGRELPAGKFPEDLLAGFLSRVSADYPDSAQLLMGPGVGEDVAVVDPGVPRVPDPREGEAGSRPDAGLLALKSDPVTFVAAEPGRYAVTVNANDLITSGASPRWFLATVLAPLGSTPSEVLEVLEDLREACGELGLALVGGHTEVTSAVIRTVICGAVAGTVWREGLLLKQRVRPGDRLLMSKGVAVEGTAILARELCGFLAEHGLSDRELHEASLYLDRLSVLPEARLALAHGGVRAMHDVTEGGLATAIRELSTATRLRVQVTEPLPVYRLTRKLAAVLDLDPLGLIGSGSLLLCVAPEAAPSLLRAFRDEGHEVAEIGRFASGDPGVEWPAQPGREWPAFAVDELARVLEGRSP